MTALAHCNTLVDEYKLTRDRTDRVDCDETPGGRTLDENAKDLDFKAMD